MTETDPKKRILALLPDLRKHLERNLSIHLKVRYPVEDVVHDTYLRALESLGTVQSTHMHSLRAWLQRIAHRLVIDRVRRKESQQANGEVASAIYAVLTSSRQLTPSREHSLAEGLRELQSALAELPHDYRQVLRLRYVERLSFAQIAAELDRTAAAIRGLHRNALKGLRRTLGGSSVYFVG